MIIVPSRFWERTTSVVSRCFVGISKFVGNATAEIPLNYDKRTAQNHLAGRILNQMFFLCHHVPWKSTPVFRLVGRELIDIALRAERGVVLWVQPTVFSDLGAKAALYGAGFTVVQLSRRSHGLSNSFFGSKILNPIWTTVEEAYLSKRLVILSDDSRAVLRALTKELKHNQLISLTAGQQSQTIYTLPFGKESICISASPSTMAWRHKATLLCVFTIREADGAIVAHIHPTCNPSEYEGRKQFVNETLLRYVSYLELYAESNPDQLKLRGLRPRPAENQRVPNKGNES